MKYRLVEIPIDKDVELEEGMIPLGCVRKRVLGEWAVSGPDVIMLQVLKIVPSHKFYAGEEVS